MKAELTLRVEHDLSAIGPEWDELFAASPGLQSGRAWLGATISAATPPGARPHLLALSDRHGPAVLLPMLAGPGRHWGSLTSPYTCLYQPLVRAEPAVSPAALQQLGRYCRRWPITRFEALDPAWPRLPAFRAGLARAGLLTRTFANFGNWHEPVAPGDWAAYLEARPGQLRETIKRRTRAADKAGAQIRIARDPRDFPAALAAYETVYRQSWKAPEPYPDFNAKLIASLAPLGVLRIGVMTWEDRPIAAQYWTIVDGVATVLKLAHDENLRSLSPGTVLTAATIRELIEIDGARELDFGRGDDRYKRDWARHRRERIGLLGLNVSTITGARAWAVHDGGRLLRHLRRERKQPEPAVIEALS